MGKGDKRTRRGKIIAGTYGVSRPHKQNDSAEESKADSKKATKAKKTKKKAE
jgi:30S ribosomal protein S31